MVGVAQLVEPRIVIPVVVGSSPIIHPIILLLFHFFDEITQLNSNIDYTFCQMIGIIAQLNKLTIGLISISICAKVAELVDALDLGSSVARRESSSLSFRTIYFPRKNYPYSVLRFTEALIAGLY